MKKKFISILLVVAMLATLVACGATNTGDETTETNTTVTETDSEAIGETTDTAVPENDTVVSGEDGEAIDEVIHEHEYVEAVTVEATCTESGTATFTCSCGDTYDEDVEAKGHDFGEYVSDGNASYTTDGTKTAKCSSCEATDTVADEGSKLSYTFTDGEAVKYAQQTVNLRSGPSTDFDKVGSLSTNDEVKVTGTCKETGWYRIVYGDGEAYVSNKYLGDNKVEVQQPAQNTNNGSETGSAAAGKIDVSQYPDYTWYDMDDFFFIISPDKDSGQHVDYSSAQSTLQSRYPDGWVHLRMGQQMYDGRWCYFAYTQRSRGNSLSAFINSIK